MNVGLPRAAALNLAYAGTRAGARALVPAVQQLRDAEPDATFSLLWPAHLSLLPAMAALAGRPILYPARRADSRSLRRAVVALRNEHADRTVVFTEAGWSADAPAYIAYLAGIRLRFGIGAEFGGGLLSHVADEPTPQDGNRHLFLLRAHGLARLSPPRSLAPAIAVPQGGDRCVP